MAAIVVCGGGVVGLCAGLMLAGDGHEVTVLEPDPTGPPEQPAAAWDDWRRGGVAQFRQPHTLFPRFRQVADAELPGLVDRLADGGCVWVDYLDPCRRRSRTARPGPATTGSASSPGGDRSPRPWSPRLQRRTPGSRSAAGCGSWAWWPDRRRCPASRTSPACAPTAARRCTPTWWSTRPDGARRARTG